MIAYPEEVAEREDFRDWRANASLLYDIARTETLHWPSLTVEWFPEKQLTDDGFFKQHLLYGTYAAEGHPNKLVIYEVELPEDIEPTSQWRSTRSQFTSQAKEKASKASKQQIIHDGEVHRARSNPHNTRVVVTRSVHNDLFVFDTSAHPREPADEAAFAPDLRLEGHKSAGWGMAWSAFHPGLLLSGGLDGTMCLWDVEGPAAAGEVLDARSIYSTETSIEDVAWHCQNPDICGGVGDTEFLTLWDVRQPPDAGVAAQGTYRHGICSSLAFNPINSRVVAVGVADGKIALFDQRRMRKPYFVLSGDDKAHKKHVTQVSWSPFHENVLASCCSGNERIMVLWDLQRVGAIQTPEEELQGPAELLFLHGGHPGNVFSFAWSPTDEWMIASVCDKNLLQVWQMQDRIHQTKPGMR